MLKTTVLPPVEITSKNVSRTRTEITVMSYDKSGTVMFDKIKYYYEEGLWSKQRVWNVVGKVLTAEEYKKITGEEYE